MQPRGFLDLRLAVPAAVLWLSESLTIWTWMSGSISQVWVAACVAVFLVAAATVVLVRLPTASRFPGSRLTAFMCLVCLIGGTGMAALRIAPLVAEPIPQMVAQRAVVSVKATLLEPVRVKPSNGPIANNRIANNRIANSRIANEAISWSGRMALIEIAEGPRVWHLDVPIQVFGTSEAGTNLNSLIPGSELAINGTLVTAEGRPGTAAVLRARDDPRVVSAAPKWQSLAHDVRSGLRDSAVNLAPDPRGLLPGLVVGDESQLDPELTDAMRVSGLSHLTAVSGANLAIVSGAVLMLARAVRVGRRSAAALATGALVAYVAVVGPEPSVVRATAMGLIALVAFALARERNGISALLASVCVLLVIDPWLSVSLGFSLSVFATGALVIFAQRSTGSSQIGIHPIVRGVRLIVGAAAAAAIATTPLIAMLGNGIPLMTVPANALVVLAVPPATILGFLSAGFAGLSPPVGEFFATLGGYPAGLIAAIARWASDLPLATLPWPGGPGGLLAAAAISALAVWSWLRRRDVVRFLTSRRNRPLVVVGGAALVAAMLLGRDLDGWPPREWVMVACDVGQGDAIVLNVGSKAAVVFDVGPDDDAVDECLRALGITHLALVVLTHFHVDHVGGLKGAMSGRTVGRVIGSPLRDPSGQASEVEELIAERGISLDASNVGEVGRVADLTYELLWPRELVGGSESRPNNASVAALVETKGLRILLTGDLEPKAQEALMIATGPVAADVVKVPHHGSRNQSPRFATWAGPSAVAVITVGRKNRYGHPAAPTVEQWQRSGATVARSDRDGDIAILSTDGENSDGAGSPSVAIRGPQEQRP